MATIPGVVDGVKFELHDDVLDDFDVLEMLSRLQDGDAFVLPKLAPMLYGKEEFARIKDELRDENGVAKSSVVIPFIMKSLEAAAESKRGELKN